MTFAGWLIAVVGFLAIGWYYACLVYLGFLAPKPPAAGEPAAFRQFMGTSISTLSGTLATFVGMILGVQSASANGAVSTAGMNAVAQALQTTPLSWLQMIAALAYVLSLVAALVAWFRNADDTDPAVVALGKSFLGLIGGVLAVVLNVNVQ